MILSTFAFGYVASVPGRTLSIVAAFVAAVSTLNATRFTGVLAIGIGRAFYTLVLRYQACWVARIRAVFGCDALDASSADGAAHWHAVATLGVRCATGNTPECIGVAALIRCAVGLN